MRRIASKDIRQQALEAYEQKRGTQQEIANIFGVHLRTLQRWITAWKKHGQLAPKPRGHYPCSFDQNGMDQLDQLVQDHPDATLQQLKELTGSTASLVSIKHALDRLGYSYKKNAFRQRTKSS